MPMPLASDNRNIIFALWTGNLGFWFVWQDSTDLGTGQAVESDLGGLSCLSWPGAACSRSSWSPDAPKSLHPPTACQEIATGCKNRNTQKRYLVFRPPINVLHLVVLVEGDGHRRESLVRTTTCVEVGAWCHQLSSKIGTQQPNIYMTKA